MALAEAEARSRKTETDRLQSPGSLALCSDAPFSDAARAAESGMMPSVAGLCEDMTLVTGCYTKQRMEGFSIFANGMDVEVIWGVDLEHLGAYPETFDRRGSEDEDEDEDELKGCAHADALLGSLADRRALVRVLQHFSKDNLADESDAVVAAIRMEVKQVPAFRRMLNIVSTCGLWLLFQPREDSASVLLTKRGRFICWGRGQEAQPGAVRAYLGNVICFLVVVFVLVILFWTWILRVEASMFSRGLLLIFSILVLVLLLSYAWAQRPRRDCGTTFRQHFEVKELCVGTYVRVDEGRSVQQLCARRRLGHLQLCFSRLYPQPEILTERLPPGTPGCGGVQPVSGLPAALAGDSRQVQKETIEQEGGVNSAVLARLAAILAVLSLIGAIYDYTSFLDKVRIDSQLCIKKVHGCSWHVDNSRLLGKVKRVAGAFPPADYTKGGCTSNGDYCDYFLRPTDHCTEKGEAFTNDATSALHVRLECKALDELADATERVTYIDPYDGEVHTRFLIKHDVTVWSMPLDPSSRAWHKVLLSEGMRITQIGEKDSEENKQLQKGVAAHPLQLLERCIGAYRGHIDVALVYVEPVSPMFEEDCHDLQEACMAEGLGPETSGYWPPLRIFDHSYEKTICIYKPMKLSFWKRAWSVLEQGQSGLTCRGTPKQRMNFSNASEIITERVEQCKDACQKEPWCTHVFYSGEVPVAFRSGFQHLPHFIADHLGRYGTNNRSSSYECLLYETCPLANLSHEGDAFVAAKCGEQCGEDEQRCMMVRQGYVRRDADRILGGAEGCKSTCIESTQDVAQCNAYVYTEASGGSCTLYGPDQFLRPYEGWHELEVNYRGILGASTDQHCFIRSTDPFHQGRVRNRQFAGGPGILLRLSDMTTCHGCVERTLFNWLKEPSALCMVLSHLITLIGVGYVAQRAHASVQLGKAAFSGKPVVHMTIVQDPANQDDFEIREDAYRKFLSKCHEVAEACRREEESEPDKVNEVDCWETDMKADVRPADAGCYERYNLANKRRTCCYVDKALLGIQPDEKVCRAWSDTPRQGIYSILLTLLLYYLVLLFLSWVMPTWAAWWVRAGFRPFFFVVVPIAMVMHYYIELRREIQSLFVVTSWGRLVHMTRRPPPDVFPAILCPAWYGGTSIQLDSFQVGEISLAQLDMPARPLLEDRLHSGFSKAWRRGTATVRGKFGLLQVTRQHGEALEMYEALNTLAQRPAKIPGLQPVGDGGANIAGVCPLEEVFCNGEQHIWEHRLDAFGFFGDPFNYSTLLTLTNSRIVVTRARWPKAFSLIGCLVGPRTCSNRCSLLQEHLGYFPYVTLTSVWYGSLESYVTERVRAPPFWPGFMSPIMSLSVLFLEKWMKVYPAALRVTQRPYGIPRRVRVKPDSTILVKAVNKGEEAGLQILSSNDPFAPRGQVVVQAKDSGGRVLDLKDGRWQQASLFEAGSQLLLKAGDPEWDNYADEPWLHQLRAILDHISGRSQAPLETWEPLEEPPRPELPGCFARMAAALFGGHMLGHRTDPDGDDSESDEMALQKKWVFDTNKIRQSAKATQAREDYEFGKVSSRDLQQSELFAVEEEEKVQEEEESHFATLLLHKVLIGNVMALWLQGSFVALTYRKQLSLASIKLIISMVISAAQAALRCWRASCRIGVGGIWMSIMVMSFVCWSFLKVYKAHTCPNHLLSAWFSKVLSEQREGRCNTFVSARPDILSHAAESWDRMLKRCTLKTLLAYRIRGCLKLQSRVLSPENPRSLMQHGPLGPSGPMWQWSEGFQTGPVAFCVQRCERCEGSLLPGTPWSATCHCGSNNDPWPRLLLDLPLLGCNFKVRKRMVVLVFTALRRLFLVTSPGLERSLERELQVLGVPGRFETMAGGLAVHGTTETLWRSVLQSRVAESVLVHVGEPFHAPDVRSLDVGLQRLPWHQYIALNKDAMQDAIATGIEDADKNPSTAVTGAYDMMGAPVIKVSSEKSRLYHTRLVQDHVAESILAALDSVGGSADSADQPLSVPPEVRVRLRHNECQVSMAASGLLHKRGHRKAVGDASLRETLAAACVLATPLQRRLSAAVQNDEELVLWDPFCGSGAILVEALGIVLGQLSGNHRKYYPFKSFPCHSSEAFRDFASSLAVQPHVAASKLTLLGSDSSEEQIGRARANLRRSLRRVQMPDGELAKAERADLESLAERVPCKVQLVQGSISKVVQMLQGRPTLIVTNVPFGIASGGKQESTCRSLTWNMWSLKVGLLLAGAIMVIVGRPAFAMQASGSSGPTGQPEADGQRLAARAALLEALKSLDRGFAATKQNRQGMLECGHRAWVARGSCHLQVLRSDPWQYLAEWFLAVQKLLPPRKMAFVEALSVMALAAYEALSLVWTELAMFGVAALVYVACMGLPQTGSKKPKGKLANVYEDAGLREAKDSWKHWEQVKKGRAELTGSPGSGLYKALTAMRQLRKSSSEVEAELRGALKGPAGAKLLAEMEALPAALLRDDAIDLLPPVLQVLQETGKRAETSTYAALMAAQLRRRDFAGVAVTASRLPEDSLTPKMRAILATAAAQRQKLDEALRQLEQLPDDQGPRFLGASAAGQILCLANKEQRGAEVQAQLQRIGVQPLQDSKDSNTEIQRAVTTMKAYVKNKDLPNVTAVFNRLKKNGVVMRSQIYNCYLDACVQCSDIEAALSLFEEMKQLGFVDVVSYNTVLKGYLAAGRMGEARSLVQEMTSRGLAANKVTYNELLNAKVAARDRAGMWSIVDQMLQAGLKANLITCSILLKSLTQHSAETDLARVLSLIDSVEEPIDEVLFSSIIEACIRIKRLDSLSDFIGRYKVKGLFKNISAPIYGAMIKAFGEAGYLHQVRELWAQLQSHNVKPTAITIGCVVEALVINKQGEEAWQLVQDQLQYDDRKSMINTVVYSTVLKGFAVSKRIDRVLAVYKEMRNNSIACNTITYNTMLDACAKCNAMEKASVLLEDMREASIEPDIITYSTIIKGYCLNGDVERALSVLEEMKRDGHFVPDEIMYNSILDGCTKQRNVGEALRLLEEMKASGIKPSNYTLSILVKLLGNARRLGQAMQMVEDLSSQHGLKPNIQVYTCLIHACFQNRRFERALGVYENMIKEGCRADEKFYAVLARGCLQLHQPTKAIEVIRAAHHLPGSSLPSGPRAVGVEGLEELLQKIGKEEQEAADELTQDLKNHGVQIGGAKSWGNSARVAGGPSRDRRRGGR
ncbi:unnamed protein product [Symbiodinium natans]|uniref:Uncharacterized protein n=1 Tax=Symbiodinium natans TaxID=878477 RepID=A0A812H0V5_9DINO|nr:unnamed protein product [Symbiodinium natans]